MWGARSLVWGAFGRAVPFIASGIAVVIAIEQIATIADARAWREPKLQAKTAILARVHDADALRQIFPDPAYVAAHIPRLRDARLAPFHAEWATWLGTPLRRHVQVAADRCLGRFEAAERVAASENALAAASWRVRGWAWDAKRARIVERILIVDGNEDVAGYALTRTARPDVIASEKSVTDLNTGWAGHAASRRDEKILAYGLLDDGRAACLLTGSPAFE